MKRWNTVLIYLLLIFFIPYSLTMVMTGVVGDYKETGKLQSGIQIKVGEMEIDLEEYVIGTMASQIPADYEKEALKCQATIQRTNILNEMERMKTNEGEKLPFSYLTTVDMEEKWGKKNWEFYYGKLKQAVLQTKGSYITYQGNYIEAYYHPVSVGMTVSAKELLGKEVKYLQSVESNQDVESKEYMTSKTISYEEAVSILKDNEIEVTEKEVETSLKVRKKTNLGYIQELEVGKNIVTGEKWKEWFHLSSSNFYLENYENQLRMISIGQGHGMGLSQYGANKMAEEGKNSDEILKYYYKKIKIETMNDEK